MPGPVDDPPPHPLALLGAGCATVIVIGAVFLCSLFLAVRVAACAVGT
jgi:hypothetical protein